MKIALWRRTQVEACSNPIIRISSSLTCVFSRANWTELFVAVVNKDSRPRWARWPFSWPAVRAPRQLLRASGDLLTGSQGFLWTFNLIIGFRFKRDLWAFKQWREPPTTILQLLTRVRAGPSRHPGASATGAFKQLLAASTKNVAFLLSSLCVLRRPFSPSGYIYYFPP